MTRLCKCFDCIDDMEGKRKGALFCSDECRHRHWQHVNRTARNAYQKRWRNPAPSRKAYAGRDRQERKSR